MNFVAVFAIITGVFVNGISGFWLPLFASTKDAEAATKATDDVNSRNLEAVDRRGEEMVSSVPVVVLPESGVFEHVLPEEGAPEGGSFLMHSEPVHLESKDYSIDEAEEEEEMFPLEPVAVLPERNMFDSIHPIEGGSTDPFVVEPEEPAVVGEVGHAFVAVPEEPDVVGEFGSIFSDRVAASISREFNYDY